MCRVHVCKQRGLWLVLQYRQECNLISPRVGNQSVIGNHFISTPVNSWLQRGLVKGDWAPGPLASIHVVADWKPLLWITVLESEVKVPAYGGSFSWGVPMRGANSCKTVSGERAGLETDSHTSLGPSGSLQAVLVRWNAVFSSWCLLSRAPRSGKWGCGQLRV